MNEICNICAKRQACSREICLSEEWFELMENKPIEFKRLNGLDPTVESCTLKVIEELGELLQVIGKGRGMSGESVTMDNREWAINSIKEALDTAQAGTTMARVLCEEYDIDLNVMVELHELKLKEKGYLA